MSKLYFGILLFLLPIICFGQVRFPFSNSAHSVSSGVDSASWEQGYKDYYYEIAEASRPGIDTADAQNTLYERITDTADVDILYFFANSYEAAAGINVIDPDGSFNINDGDTITWTQYEGYTTDGTNDYLNTNFSPGNDAINSGQDDIAIWAYHRTFTSGTGSFGIEDAGYYLKLTPNTTTGDGVFSFYINDGSSAAYDNDDGVGFVAGIRNASAGKWCYQNGDSLYYEADASTGVCNDVGEGFYFGAVNNDGVAYLFNDGQISVGGLSEGLTTEQLDEIYAAIEEYMDYLGKGVND